MDKLKIREGKIILNGQELRAVTALETKSTTENGYAEVTIKLLAKLV